MDSKKKQKQKQQPLPYAVAVAMDEGNKKLIRQRIKPEQLKYELVVNPSSARILTEQGKHDLVALFNNKDPNEYQVFFDFDETFEQDEINLILSTNGFTPMPGMLPDVLPAADKKKAVEKEGAGGGGGGYITRLCKRFFDLHVDYEVESVETTLRMEGVLRKATPNHHNIVEAAPRNFKLGQIRSRSIEGPK